MTRKTDIAMSPGEIERFVHANDCAFVGHLDERGRITAHAFRYAAAEGKLLLRGSGAILPGSACAVIDSYPSYDAIIGVMLRGGITECADGARLEIRHAGGFDFSKTRK